MFQTRCLTQSCDSFPWTQPQRFYRWRGSSIGTRNHLRKPEKTLGKEKEMESCSGMNVEPKLRCTRATDGGRIQWRSSPSFSLGALEIIQWFLLHMKAARSAECGEKSSRLCQGWKASIKLIKTYLSSRIFSSSTSFQV